MTAAGAARATTSTDATQYRIVAAQSEASYTVNEKFANIETPVDAVGKTRQIAGQIVLGADGTTMSGGTITINVQSLTSDQERRDAYLRVNSLESNTYPEATFALTGVEGLNTPLAATPTAFKLTGQMTLHGVTKPLTWDATATLAGDTLTGTATTTFKMADFGITQPQVAVLTTADTVKLDVRLTAVQA